MAQFHLSSELVAIYSAGRSFFRLILFPCIFSLVIGLSFMLANEFYFNTLKQKANHYKTLALKGHIISDGETIIRTKNLRGKNGFYYINFFNPSTNKISGGFSYLMLDKDNKPHSFYEAAEASYHSSKQKWLLKKIRILKFNSEIRISQIIRKASLLLRLAEGPDFFARLSLNPEDLSLLRLSKEIDYRRKQGVQIVDYAIEFHSRLILPITCSLLCFIGAIGGSSGRGRGASSFTRSLFLCTIAILIYYFGFSFSYSIAKSGELNPSFAPWLPVIIYLILSIYFINKANFKNYLKRIKFS